MLMFYHRLALKLQRFRWLILVVTLGGTLGFLSLLVFAPAELAQKWQLTSIVIAIIGLLAYLMSLLFIQPIAQVGPEHSFIYRVKIRFQQTFSYLLAMLLSMIVLAVLFLSLRALTGIIAILFFN
ncbi:hypothetical protein [Rheinheimera salexigens]|uniref:Uncharacterized protein n=1 Tax=Rheinheimera salexigens TaxID=1628148 RepID=A0A1E7Q5Y4_9GAMM|nr:hypothetical protein [Rheinheimera salexigens]OEY69546.1 hypothetical protein BI198_08215 [Rheinheimera salexigens]